MKALLSAWTSCCGKFFKWLFGYDMFNRKDIGPPEFVEGEHDLPPDFPRDLDPDLDTMRERVEKTERKAEERRLAAIDFERRVFLRRN